MLPALPRLAEPSLGHPAVPGLGPAEGCSIFQDHGGGAGVGVWTVDPQWVHSVCLLQTKTRMGSKSGVFMSLIFLLTESGKGLDGEGRNAEEEAWIDPGTMSLTVSQKADVIF